MELWGEYVLCYVAIQNTKLIVIAMHMLPCYYAYLHNCLHTVSDHAYCRQVHIQVVKFSSLLSLGIIPTRRAGTILVYIWYVLLKCNVALAREYAFTRATIIAN